MTLTIKFNTPTLIRINLVNHILEFGVCRVLTERSHHLAEFVGRDTAGLIFVKEIEDIAEGLDCFFVELFDGGFGCSCAASWAGVLDGGVDGGWMRL